MQNVKNNRTKLTSYFAVLILSTILVLLTPQKGLAVGYYDLGFATGTYGGQSYSEIHGAYNWYLAKMINFRNSLFVRSGDVSILGLDSSVRYVYRAQSGKNEAGWTLYAGPGVRISDKHYSGWFIEGGAIADLNAFIFGLGFQSISYNDPDRDGRGLAKPGQDTNLLIILGIGF